MKKLKLPQQRLYLLSAVLLMTTFCSSWRPWSSATTMPAAYLAPPEAAYTPHSNTIVWATDSLTKVRTDSACPATSTTSIKLSAARNEYEPFQIIVAAGDKPLKMIDIEVTPLTSSNNRSIGAQNISVYREAFINVKTPSNIEGRAGLWPDALVPKVDSYVGETRNGFPFDLEPQRLQPVWVDLYVPADAAPGEYSGRVRVLEGGRELSSIDVKLQVWDFQIPATSSLPNSFGFAGSTALKGHFGRYTSDEDIIKFTELYSKAALQHRISLHGGSGIPPLCEVDKDHVKIDWKNYDREVGPFLDGKVLPSGARFTSIDLRTPSSLVTDEQKIAYWRQFASHFKEKGWFDRLFDYTWDEPGEQDFAKICSKASLLKRADPQLNALVTKELNPKLQSSVGIWTVVINYIDDKPGNSNSPARSTYDRELAAGRKLWWYQSCMSHGCNVVGEEYFTGWPAYIIDLPAIYSRIMPWAAWKYRIGGELYFNTVEAYEKTAQPGGDPWDNLYLFGGNGDGTLFYPGRPDRIGGKTHIPVESIRLKLIREGLEDYEYLRLAAARTNQQTVDKLVDRIVTKTYQWDHNPAHLMELRAQLATLITSGQR